jgi:DNA-binding NarL/FixJ family response regulator
MAVIRVVIVDDQQVFCEALSSRLGVESDISIVGAAESQDSALSLIDLRHPDVVIVDFEIQGDDATDILSELSRRYPDLPMAVVSEHDDPGTAAAAVRAGARAFVPKTASISELVDAVRGLSAGGSQIPPHLLTGVLDTMRRHGTSEEVREPLDRLTLRELDVLREMLAGRDRATIAARLFMSINTVRTHIKHILAKLEVHSSVEAVSVAIRAGLRPSEDETDRRSS